MKTTTKTLFEIEIELKKELKSVAALKGVTMKQVLNDSIKEWIDRNKK